MLYVLVNGEPVGIAKDSRTPAEFDISDLVRHDGPNELVAVVVRWSDASFVEDQDQWWHAGISRSIRARARRVVRDVESPAPTPTGGSRSTPTATARSRLLDARGRVVATGELADGRLEARVRAPRLWSAEEPALYTLERERRGRDGLDAASASARVEIRDRQLLVNGEPVLIRGVNRHEHDDTPRPRRLARADGARRRG